ncbi:MAG: hypothetical protein WC728_10795 [Elusimicrobiota bacterium]
MLCTFPHAWAGGDAGHAGSFLRQEADARGAAMAGAVTAVADDSTALYWNPAGLSRLLKPEVQGTHITLFQDTQFDFASGALATRWGTFAAGILRQNSGDFERRATPFDQGTSFSISQTAFMGGWGMALPLPFKPAWVSRDRPLEVGVSVKNVRETIDTYSASGSGADLGFGFRPSSSIFLGAAIQNVWAPELTFVRRPVSYPRTLDVSPAYLLRLSDELAALLAVRVSKTDGRGIVPSGGAELSYRDFACLRVGDGEKGVSTGFGLRLGNSSFDYAVLMHELGLSHIFSFTQRFGHTQAELEASIRKGIRKLNRGEAQRLAKAYVRSAELKLKQDDLTGAVRDLEVAGLWDPDDPDIPQRIAQTQSRMDGLLRERLVESTAAMAREEFAKGNTLASRQYWRAVLETAPDHAEAKERLSAIDRQLSAEERSALESMRVKQLELARGQTLDNAEALLKKGQSRQAVALLEQALLRDPEHSKARALLEEARAAVKAAAEAEAARAKAPAPEKVALSDEQRRNMERLYYRAVEFYLNGRYAEARALVDQVMAIDPASDSALKLRDKVDAALRLEKR